MDIVMDQRVYKESQASNPLVEAVPTRDGNRSDWRPWQTCSPSFNDPKLPTGPRDKISHLRHRMVEGGNLLAGIQTFFQKNTYHPFAICGYSECGKTGPTPMSYITDNTTSEQPLPTRSIEHFCEGETCFRTDLTNFRSTRPLTRDETFLDKAGIFDFWTIASGETIREPVTTLREFSQFILRMPSHKAPDFSAGPADLFKQAPAPFQRCFHLLVSEILVGEYDCDKDLLMVKVILIHKDKDIAILDHYRPIALLNTIYHLIMIIITS